MTPLTVLHTSDWHLGQNLYNRKRYDESRAFLDWLLALVEQEHVQVLLVAGDVFDTNMPTNRAQKLYYDFLVDIARTPCRHVVIIGGNHDSPTFLNAPAGLLRRLHVHVIGQALEPCGDEVLTLCNSAGDPELLVCAVPYLRDRDIRRSEAGETQADMASQREGGIRRHYEAVFEQAREKRAGREIPLVAMGHLFTVGGHVVEGDGVRDLYVGSLGGVGADIFPADADYVALGHLHAPQEVAKNVCMRYSGAPMPMSFTEAQARKSVVLARFAGRTPTIELAEVPVFQELVRLEGNWNTLAEGLQALKERDAAALVDIIYTGQTPMTDLGAQVEALVQGSRLDIARMCNNQLISAALSRAGVAESLQDMTVDAVFERCLEQYKVPDVQRDALRRTYAEAVASYHEQDKLAQ